jgi:hypothetical protein
MWLTPWATVRIYLDHLDREARAAATRRKEWEDFWVQMLCGSGDADPLESHGLSDLMEEFKLNCGARWKESLGDYLDMKAAGDGDTERWTALRARFEEIKEKD